MLGKVGVLAATAMCSTQVEPTIPAEQVPERQFILEGVRLEERRDGRVLWVGTGKRSDGDLSVSEVTDLVLVRKPQEANEVELKIFSPQGHLAFDEGKAVLDSVRIEDQAGRTMHAGQAHYDEKAGTLSGDGPISFITPSMQAHARTAVVWLKEGTVEIRGPVDGRLAKSSGLEGLTQIRKPSAK